MSVKKIEAALTLDGTKFKKGLSDAEKDVAKFTASITALGVAALGIATLTAKWQDETIKASRAAGTTAENFSAMAHAAEMSGVSTEELTKSYTKLNNVSGQTAENLARVGISLNDNTGKLKTSDQLFGDIADKMQKMKSPADQAALAVQVFGEEGNKMVSLLKDGSAGLESMRQEAEKLGVVVSTQAGQAAEKFNDDMARTIKTFQGLGMAISESIIAFANQSGIMDTIRAKIQEITAWWRGLSDETKNTIVKIGALVVAFAGILTVTMAVLAILPALKTAFATLMGPVGLVILGIGALATLFMSLGDLYEDTSKKTRDAAESHQQLSMKIAEATQRQNENSGSKQQLAHLTSQLHKQSEQLGVAIHNNNGIVKSNTQLVQENTAALIKNLEAEAENLKLKLWAQEKVLGAVKQEAAKDKGFLVELFVSSQDEKAIKDQTERVKKTGEELNKVYDAIASAKRPATMNNFAKSISNVNDKIKDNLFLLSATEKSLRQIDEAYQEQVKYANSLSDAAEKQMRISEATVKHEEMIIEFNNKQREKYINSVVSDYDIILENIQKERKEKLEALSDVRQIHLREMSRQLIAEKARAENEIKISKMSAKEKGEALKKLEIDLQTEKEEATLDIFLKFQERRLQIEEDIAKKTAQAGIENFSKMIQEYGNHLSTLTGAAGQLVEALGKDVEYETAVALRDLDKLASETAEHYEKSKLALESSENAKIKLIEESYQKQIDALRFGENSKNNLLQSSMNERLLLLDSEYQNAKAKAQKDFEDKMARERANFELEKELLTEKSYDKEQRRFVELELNNDFNEWLKLQQETFENDLTELQKNYLANRKDAEEGFKSETKANEILHGDEIKALELQKKEAIEKANEEKNNKLKELDEERTKTEKEQEQKRLQIQYDAEMTQFNNTKVIKSVETMVAGISGAAQAFSSLAAIPFIGLPLGFAAAATIMGATIKSVSMINSQKPIKPATLLEDGGYISGNTTHAMGGLSANIESKEFVIDKNRTQKIYDFIENSTQGREINIVFENGSIVTQNADEALINNISNGIVNQLRRQGVVG